MAILPKPLQRFCIDGNNASPQYVKPTTAVFQLEAQIIDNYRYSIDDTYELLNDTLEPLCQSSQRHKLIRGMIHILDKRLAFEEQTDMDPVKLRLALFEKAAQVTAEDFEKKHGAMKSSVPPQRRFTSRLPHSMKGSMLILKISEKSKPSMTLNRTSFFRSTISPSPSRS